MDQTSLAQKPLAQVAYEAYCARTNNKSLATGQDLPTWANLTPVIQDAWGAAASGVVDAINDGTVKIVGEGMVDVGGYLQDTAQMGQQIDASAAELSRIPPADRPPFSGA
jgi:hypothetical protein